MKKTLYGLSLLLALSVLLPACQCTEAPATKTPLTEAQLSTEQKIKAAAIATDPDYVLMWKKEAEHQQRINAAVSTFSPQNRKAWFILMEELLQHNPDAYARKLGYTENGAGRELADEHSPDAA